MKAVILLFILQTGQLLAQQLYFPPTSTADWETVDPGSIGWCTDQLPPLLDFLDDNNTKAFIVLKDGRIAIEHYFDTFTQDSLWYWASAGKSLTAFLVGLAQQEGSLNIDSATSNYLGNSWTSLTPEQEEAITVRHQLTMTTGLNDGGELDCTDPACLQFLAEPGTRWSYHNAPYTLLDEVIASATGQTLNAFLFTRLTQTTGLTGAYVNVGFNNVFFSKPRSMARFGLLMQAQGSWSGNAIMNDTGYFNAMITPSQELNEAYGYLWWLNGQESFMLPQSQFVFNGSVMPNAPADAFNALGRDGQILNVSPSQGLVVVRMGEAPDGIVFVPNVLNDQIWQHLNAVICSTTSIASSNTANALRIHPNPVIDVLNIELPHDGSWTLTIRDLSGRLVFGGSLSSHRSTIDVSALAAGSYIANLKMKDAAYSTIFVKQ
jgi:CubicO group peptidase (beta-lactamase class C family)